MNIPLDDNRLKEAKIIVMDYSDSLDQKQRRILPRQDSEDPNVFQQRTPIASERPPAHVVQAIGQLFVYHFINSIFSSTCNLSCHFYLHFQKACGYLQGYNKRMPEEMNSNWPIQLLIF